MTDYPINHDPEPIRLFESDFLEFFSHISPVAVVIIWVPIVGFFLWRAFLDTVAGMFSIGAILTGLISGLILWTLAEYLLHRFVFHYKARNKIEERLSFLFHGIHHAQPQCKTRLVMPPIVSLPMALVFYAFFSVVAGVIFQAPAWVNPLMGGFITGYLVYDLTHYATHHFPMRSGILKYLKRHHMQHHYKTPDLRFGVSSPIWDFVFRTQPEE